MRQITLADLDGTLRGNSKDLYHLLMSVMKGLVLATAALAATDILVSQVSAQANPDWQRSATPWVLLGASVALAVTSLFATVVGVSITRFTTTLWDLVLILVTGAIEVLLCFIASKPALWSLWVPIAGIGVVGHALKAWSVLQRCPESQHDQACRPLIQRYRAHLKEAIGVMLGFVTISLGLHLFVPLAGYDVLVGGCLGSATFVIGMFRIEGARRRAVAALESCDPP